LRKLLQRFIDVCEALEYAHSRGVLHRDLKPGNIMLRDDGTVALIDFGISRSAHVNKEAADGPPSITGTPYYMSPEQARGSSTDERTDLYALGVMLYQMLTGEKPYAGDTPEAILEQHCNAPVPRLPSRLALYQPLLDRMLAKDATQRLSSARELHEAIDALEAAAEADAENAEALSA
jgi:serine/threonine protein kinase